MGLGGGDVEVVAVDAEGFGADVAVVLLDVSGEVVDGAGEVFVGFVAESVDDEVVSVIVCFGVGSDEVHPFVVRMAFFLFEFPGGGADDSEVGLGKELGGVDVADEGGVDLVAGAAEDFCYLHGGFVGAAGVGGVGNEDGHVFMVNGKREMLKMGFLSVQIML